VLAEKVEKREVLASVASMTTVASASSVASVFVAVTAAGPSSVVTAVSAASTVASTATATSVLHGSFNEQFYLFKSETDIVLTFDRVLRLYHGCEKVGDGYDVEVVLQCFDQLDRLVGDLCLGDHGNEFVITVVLYLYTGRDNLCNELSPYILFDTFNGPQLVGTDQGNGFARLAATSGTADTVHV